MLSFLLSDSGVPATVDIHDVPFVPAAAVIPNSNSVRKWCCGLHYFCKYSNSSKDNRKFTDIVIDSTKSYDKIQYTVW